MQNLTDAEVECMTKEEYSGQFSGSAKAAFFFLIFYYKFQQLAL